MGCFPVQFLYKYSLILYTTNNFLIFFFVSFFFPCLRLVCLSFICCLIGAQLFSAVCYGAEVASCLSVFEDTKRERRAERSGPEGRRQREERRQRNGGGAVRRLGGRVPVDARQKGKNSDGAEDNRTPTPRKKIRFRSRASCAERVYSLNSTGI